MTAVLVVGWSLAVVGVWASAQGACAQREATLCCCETVSGHTCCAKLDWCGVSIPGCMCR